ncbi:hypothetical protein HY310_00960 [Candidatus Microgenomates bacterium]|nr:hypothetical protein [Candidatus Microgenomates bacterium]
MKLLTFDRKEIKKISERLVNFWPKHRLFMSWKKSLKKYFSLILGNFIFIFSFIFLSVIFINIFTPKSNFLVAKENVLINLKNKNSHYLLAQQLFASNNYDLAIKEFSISGNPPPVSINKPEDIRNEIIFWKNLIIEVPNYRDAYLKLFSLNEQIYLDLDAKEFLKRAQEIDPNNDTIKKLFLP